MFLRIDRLAIELPKPKKQDPASAASVQELLGGRFGEMSTLMNYTYQSFNFRGHVGNLFVRGGVHALAYAKALEQLTGVQMSKMLPIPRIENKMFPEAAKFEAQGSHRRLYRFSPKDYHEAGVVWQGTHPDDGQPLEFVDGPPAGGKGPELANISEAFAPEYKAEEIFEMAQQLYKKTK